MPYDSVFRPGLFAGQVGLVTGGGSGIGRAIAHELAHLGAHVVLASRDEGRLAAVAREIEADGGRASGIACNVRREEEVGRLVERVVGDHGRVDLLVNNAGGQFLAPAESIPQKGWHAVIETNLTGTFLVSREVYLRSMKERGGAIVNIVADMWRGMPMMAHSGAARAGVVNLTQTLALEWAHARVRVNAVAPGYVASSGLKSYPEFVQQGMLDMIRETPARRFATEGEVSGAVAFLLSPAASYVSGATLRVDGASSLYRHAVGLPEHAGWPAYQGLHRAADLPAVFGGAGGGDSGSSATGAAAADSGAPA